MEPTDTFTIQCLIGLEYIYIESAGEKDFKKFFFEIKRKVSSWPSSGSSAISNRMIRMPNGVQLFGIMYTGGIEEYSKVYMERCRQLNLRWAVIEGDQLVLSDGSQIALRECEAYRYNLVPQKQR